MRSAERPLAPLAASGVTPPTSSAMRAASSGGTPCARCSLTMTCTMAAATSPSVWGATACHASAPVPVPESRGSICTNRVVRPSRTRRAPA